MSTKHEPPVLRVITPGASADEVAAIVAALSALSASRTELAAETEPVSRWVSASRLSARRAGYSRGEWRLSGRIGRRSRA